MAARREPNGRRKVSRSGLAALEPRPSDRDLNNQIYYCLRGFEPAANTYYRVEVPFKVLKKLGLGLVNVEDHRWMVRDDLKHFLIQMGKADYHLYYGAPSQEMHERVLAMQAIKPGRSGPFGAVKSRPTIIWTLDDNYHHVHPLNQAFLWNGYRLPTGEIMGAGDDCKIELPGGEIVTLWRYGHRYGPNASIEFRPDKNREKILKMDRLLRSVDGVTFSSTRLETWYRKHARLRNTFFYPNSIYFPDYEWVRGHKFMRDDPSIVKVLWQGGSSHFGDLLSIKGSIERLVKRFPKVKWVFWGAKFEWVERVIPDRQYEYIRWVPYDAYRPMLATIDFDFALAPLVPNVFNDGKSCIKFYEPAALPNPKPTICAKVPPYSDEMIDGEIGFAYDPSYPAQFEDRFAALVEDAELRHRLATRCQEWLREHRDAEKTTPPYVQWLRDARGAGYGLSPDVADLAMSVVERSPHTFTRVGRVQEYR